MLDGFVRIRQLGNGVGIDSKSQATSTTDIAVTGAGALG